MNDKDCKNCLYDDICKSKTACKHYTPSDVEMSDAELDEYIESTRREFHNEWWKYIDEDAEQAFYFLEHQHN